MDQLKRLRTEKGLSQAKLAALADIDPSTVNQIERGAREASPATLRKLAEALNVSIAELLEDAAPKAESRSSLEPSFNDVLEDERREDRVIALMEILTEEGQRVFKHTESSPGVLPVGGPNRFYAACDEASRLYDELARAGRASEELGNAKKNLDEVTESLGQALHLIIKPGGEEMYERREGRRRKRAGSQEQERRDTDTGVA